MGSVKTLLPAEGVERKQKLFAFLLDLCSTSSQCKVSVLPHTTYISECNDVGCREPADISSYNFVFSLFEPKTELKLNNTTTSILSVCKNFPHLNTNWVCSFLSLCPTFTYLGVVYFLILLSKLFSFLIFKAQVNVSHVKYLSHVQCMWNTTSNVMTLHIHRWFSDMMATDVMETFHHITPDHQTRSIPPVLFQ